MKHSAGSVVVVGSYVTDLMSRAPRMPLPGETVLGGPFKLGPGGKGANQAVAAARAGAKVTMVTKVGMDTFGEIAKRNFVAEGIGTEFVFQDPEMYTGAALIVVEEGSGQNMIVVAIGANETLTREDIDKAKAEIERADVLLVQFEANLDATEYAAGIAKRAGKMVIINPAPYREFPPSILTKADIVTPNETELASMTRINVTDLESAESAARKVLNLVSHAVIVTMGANGSLIVTKAGVTHLLPPRVAVIDTTGAGDAFSGALACALAEGKELVEAAKFANAAAALSVTKIGTAPAMPRRVEIDRLLTTIQV